MRRILALLACLLLLTVPATAQAPQPAPETLLVIAARYDGMAWVPLPGGLIIPPELLCGPS